MRFYGQAKGRKWHTEQPEPTPYHRGLKPCVTCGEWKHITEFYEYKSKSGEIRTRNTCKVCERLKQREYKARRAANDL